MWRHDTLVMKVSKVGAWTVYWGRLFQSLTVLGKKLVLLCSVLQEYCLQHWSWPRLAQDRDWNCSSGLFALASLLMTVHIRRVDWRCCSRIGQLRFCSIPSTLDVLWYLWRTNHTACLCTASIRKMSFLVVGSQTELAYSRSGLTSDL